MFNAKVYKIAVISLSGVMEETYAAKEIVQKWNQENAENTGKLFLLVDELSRPDLAKQVDIVIGIVSNRVEQGDFIHRCLSYGKQVVLFFNAFPDFMNTIPSEQRGVEAFRNEVQDSCICADYNSIAELRSLLNHSIGKAIEC